MGGQCGSSRGGVRGENAFVREGEGAKKGDKKFYEPWQGREKNSRKT